MRAEISFIMIALWRNTLDSGQEITEAQSPVMSWKAVVQNEYNLEPQDDNRGGKPKILGTRLDSSYRSQNQLLSEKKSRGS